MDETTISDIKQRVARWEKDLKRDGRESERTWIFAVNVDDVNLLLKTIEGQEREIADLREQLHAFAGHLTYPMLTLDQAETEFIRQPTIEVNDGNGVVARFTLDGEALEPTPPDGQMHYFFNVASGPYRALDIQAERDFTWARGPFTSWNEADQAWKAYIKQQRADGKS